MNRLRPAYPENDLVSLIRQNNKDAFDYLYANYAAALYKIIAIHIKDAHTAEDILQETFINIWTNIEKYDAGKARLYTWMRQIAVNKSIDFLRCSLNQLRANTTGEDAYGAITTYSENKTDNIGINQLVAKMLPEHRIIICLAYYGGHTLAEIGELLNIPLGTIKTRLRRAVMLLRDEFAYHHTLPEASF